MLVAFLGLVTYVSFKFGPAITRLMSHPERFKEFVDKNGSASALLYILIQAAHVIIVVIPGEIVQIAGGYAFGTFLGTLYSLIGITMGTLIVFFATRLVGYSLVRTFVSPEKLKKFDFLINSSKSEIALFILFLIPGLPKDTLVYISGLTPVKSWRFLSICTIARFPGLWGSAYIGANLQEKDYVPVWIMSGLALVLFVVGILVKDKVISRLHRHWYSGKDTPPGN
ncbi:MAG: VTT domain-containing protein [Candidatus Aminicenantes bacterium]|nr:VTT domain-containing protein [Candidatus Aminicenantes bacterium]